MDEIIKTLDPEDTIASTIVDIVPYMETLGYQVSQETSSLLFQVFSKMDPGSFKSIFDLEPLFESFIASTPRQHESFPEDFRNFVRNRHRIVVDDETARDIRNIKRKSKNAMSRKTALDKEIEQKQKKISSLKKKAELEDGPPVNEKTVRSYNKKYEQIQKDYRDIFKNSPSAKILLNLQAYASGECEVNSEEELDKARKDLKAGARKAIGKKNAKELLDLIDKQNSLLNTMKKSFHKSAKADLNRETEMLQKLEEQRKKAEIEAERVVSQIKAQLKEIQKKTSSGKHRETFEKTQNAVRSDFRGEPSMEKEFKTLTPQEKHRIRDYIVENARKFKTRMSRNIRTGLRRRIDIPETCKDACKTMGIPVNLSFIKPERQKSRLVMFLDVSGSCKSASEMMLTFIHEMREVFPGGCRTYVFTNRLYDVSEIFEESTDSEVFVKTVLDSIPRAGAYSDYYTPLKDFYDNHMSELTKDSLLFFIGDARNNKNKSGEWYLKALARRAKKAYWLNTETIDEWDTGDSIMSIYSKYMAKTTQVTTTGELLNFLQEVK